MLWFILFLFNFHLQHSSLLLLFCLNRLIIGLHIGAKTVVLSFSCFSHTESHHQSLIVNICPWSGLWKRATERFASGAN